MLFVKVNGKEKGILFRHNREEMVKGANTQSHPVSTDCSIFDNDKNCLGMGTAIVAKSDTFSYETGRRLALTRALVAADIPRAEREQVWAQYHQR